MDKIRILLLACLAMITFAIVIQFAEFRDAKNKQALLSQTSTENSSLISSTVIEDNSDLEQGAIPSIQTTAQDKAKPVEKSAPSSNLIQVKTDNFNLSINPKGGDIVALSLNKFSARLDTPNIPFQLLQDTQQHVYIAQSGIIGPNGTDLSVKDRPLFHSEKTHYQMQEGQDTLTVQLSFQQSPDVTIIKQFVFHKNQYLIDINYLIKNASDKPWQGALYGQIRHDNKKVEHSAGIGMKPYVGFATSTNDTRFEKIAFDDIDEGSFSANKKGGWMALIQHYFVGAWVPNQEKDNHFSTIKTSKNFYLGQFQSPNITVAANSEGKMHAAFYAGPKDQYELAKISPSLDLTVDYGYIWMVAQPVHTILYFLAEGTLNIFGHQYHLFPGIGNWGMAIILLTILIKLIFFGLNAKAYRSMAKMRAVQPKMLEIRERYPDDRQKQSQAMMQLYSKEKVNPLGGCLPILVQMPVFIALYWVIVESVELRHAPFIGYITDLSAMDPYFILPAIMGISMFFQQQLNPMPADPMQAKIMKFLPIIFTFFFLFFPAGLVLYWVVNNILSIAQQWVITKNIEKESSKSHS